MGEEKREPVLEDSYVAVNRCLSLAFDLHDRLQEIHHILDEDFYQFKIGKRAREEPKPNFRFGMYAIIEDLKQELYAMLDSVRLLKQKLILPRDQKSE